MKAGPAKVFKALTDPKIIEKWSGSKAKMSAKKGAKFEIWGPEEGTSDYYAKLMPMALTSGSGAAPARGGGVAAASEPPPGVDAGAFYDLVSARARGLSDNLLQIDKAANNTSKAVMLPRKPETTARLAHPRWRGWADR